MTPGTSPGTISARVDVVLALTLETIRAVARAVEDLEAYGSRRSAHR